MVKFPWRPGDTRPLHTDNLEKGFPFAQQHFEQVSKRVGWPIPIPEDVINSLAYAALSDGKTQEAIELFRRNVEANPNSANAYDGLADGYAEAGNWKEAVRASERAVALATEVNHPNLPYFIAQSRKMNERLEQDSGR